MANNVDAGPADAWQGLYETDAFNPLVSTTSLTPKEVNVLRAYGHALKHMELPFAITTIARALSANPAITQNLWAYFDARFTPHASCNESTFITAVKAQLSGVKQREEDIILRAFLSLIGATVRTNYFQQERGYISFKVESARIHHLPSPKPLYEIFVYAPYMEGCHLRAGKVARGGIRWSDRMEDLRREIWGLMCTQTVKNAIIVPTGAKGGFICKNMPRLHAQGASKEVIATEVARCYQTLIRGMLDLTDTIQNGQVIKPADMRIYDGDDPYLAVAADKGTATFSDIANAIAAEYSFWLGDAFASGGSKGYDHKKMAITARGAWVSVHHHFQALGMDVNKQPITVVGVGDMSGDVFGNGMLHATNLKLVAAFNHQYIFLDPTPVDVEASFNERLRLFHKPGSSWADYNPALISPGGGVYSRALKAIPLTPHVAACLGVEASVPELTPEALIQHILRAPVDLLWFGGIGTYVRATCETDKHAADPHNDSVRITAAALRAKVIGEGANLPLTQHARIEYAKEGGRLNMDSIDNSAGVDCSDHEVNLKILLRGLEEEGALSVPGRDALLKEVEGDVARHVLHNNLNQNRILTLMEWEAPRHVGEYQQLLKIFLIWAKRTWDALPDASTLEMRLLKGQAPLVRPELCTILSHGKNSLKKSLSGQLDTPFFEEELTGYFPPRIQKQYGAFINRHLLKNELLSTLVANRLMNLLGPCFVMNTLGALNQSPATTVMCMYQGLRTLGLEAMEAQLYSLVDSGAIEKAGAFMRGLQREVHFYCQ
jgi:glutamate dehydrogenase